jgi:hypothetical protein
MVSAVELSTEGGVGVFVLEGLDVRLLLGFSFLAALASVLRSWRSEGVVIEVPSWWGKFEPRGFSEMVGRAGLVERS